ncbi:uncharacterized protein M437DRAFT_38503 [Aureobasidium melanogenum CBS 110374]|uniref:Uncharacterized protein n=1 Tax=Aureobasidium melanogenum (strain CBS 110374) TaxID=1043003 RepID=A0A074WCQ6_AURM1|nr:uncharacterized protein M437DRAFT_38503 [Aureobasidium melanogenum CBS 110374]KEQ67672.1 hypothetical protein M437DRAFT_38503 [Aureobasidium melanogenum CBS 110374]
MAAPLSEDEIRQITLNGANLVPRQLDQNILHDEVARITNLFQRIFSTLRADLTNQHRTAACNLLSNLVEKCALSQEHDFLLLLWRTEKFWHHAFWIYLDQHHALNVKPSRLLLTSLTSALTKYPDKSICESEKTALLESLVQHVGTPSENAPTRPAMQVLAHWLSKNVIFVDELCHAFGKISIEKDNQVSHSVQDVLAIVLRLAPYEDFASSAGSLAALILQKARPTDQSSAPLALGNHYASSWSSTVLDILKQKPEALGILRLYVFPEIFQQDRPSFVAFVDQLGIRSILGRDQPSEVSLPLSASQCEEVLFCALSVGSKLGLVKVADVGQTTESIGLFFEKDVLCIPDVLLGDLLLRTSDAVRIAGLAMLTTSTVTTQPLSIGAMNSLQKGLPFLHADADSGFRSELFSLIRHLMDRIKAATATLTKPPGKSKKNTTKTPVDSPSVSTQSSELVAAHKSFVEWYVAFLKTELRPTASYQRHISALKCISIVSRSGVDTQISGHPNTKSTGATVLWPFTLNVVDDEMTDLLIDLLLDAFDDVRSMATEILSLVNSDTRPQNGVFDTPMLVKVLARAQKMLIDSGRADHADGVAHLYSILFNQCSHLNHDSEQWWASRYGILGHLVHAIEQTVETAKADISRAVSKHPLHGLFISLRYIIDKPGFYQTMSSDPVVLADLQKLYLRLYDIFQAVWMSVHDTLCKDTTEGLAAEELEEEDIGTKDVLSYSWRALKESSLLLRSIVKNCPLDSPEQILLSSQQLRQLGDLTFTQLAELRHRGAFSTVAQTFVVCCMRSNSGTNTVSQTLEEWYKRAILCIQNQTAINTRRSAGLPSLMIGIVVADTKGLLFSRAMSELTTEGTRPVNQAAESAGGLSQVHALNCIKDIFKNSKLGERSEAYVPQALSLAAGCLSSDTWAVRNSGLMLFRALMDRLIGTNDAFSDEDTHTQNRLSEEAITSLMQIVLQLLTTDADVDQAKAEVVFPALQFLQRVQPPSNLAEDIKSSVLRLASSRQWLVRDKAAKTYSTLVPAINRISRVAELVRHKSRSQNEAHGVLLAAKYLVERQGKNFNTEDMDAVVNAVQSRIDDLFYDNACSFTQAAFIDVQNAFFYAAIQKQRHLFVPGTRWATTEDMNIILDLPRDHFAACSFLRQSLALSLIHEHALFSGPSSDNSAADLTARLDTLALLAIRDPDACTTALREAARIGSTDSVYATQTKQLLVSISAKLLLDGDVDIEVRDAAQEVLINLLSQGAAEDVKKTVFTDLKQVYLPSGVTTPLYSDKQLILQGALLNFRAQDHLLRDHRLTEDFEQWIVQVRYALQDSSPFDTRYAAVIATQQLDEKSLAYFNSIDSSNTVLQFCLAVYDLCNDDDIEIRTLAAPVATNILNTGSDKKKAAMVPLAANQGLAEFISSAFNSNTLAASAAISRATANAVTTSFPDSVKASLAAKTKPNSSLFAHEKHNLFIDETREARLWSSIAARLHPTAFSFRLIMNLSTWVIDGLDVLIAEVETKPDTPLGWSRKAEVFVLGMQVLYAAQLVLNLSKRGVEMPVRASAVVKRVEMLLKKGKENGVNVLWLQTGKEILEQQI